MTLYKRLFRLEKEENEVENKNGIFAVVGIFGLLSAFVLYCCIRVGAQADQQMEKLHKKGGTDAGGEKG